MIRIVHIVNQFFAGIGGEDKAGVGVGVTAGAAGAARGLEAQLGGRGQVIATIHFGDNYFHEQKQEALAAILAEVEKQKADVVVVGPAFNAGRYGLACVEICQGISERLGLACVTGMEPENPAVSLYRDAHNEKVFLFPTAETTAGMASALKVVTPFACRVALGEKIGTADAEGYVARGIRRLTQVDRPAVDRAIDMLLAKVAGEPFQTEVPMEVWDKVAPAAPLPDAAAANLAVICTGGVVPWGNPDGFKTYRNTFWRKYNFAELKSLDVGQVGSGARRLQRRLHESESALRHAARRAAFAGKRRQDRRRQIVSRLLRHPGQSRLTRSHAPRRPGDRRRLEERGDRRRTARRHVRNLQSQRRCD